TQGFEVGGVDYIAKPIQPPIVRARVRTHVELKQARDLLAQLAWLDGLTGIANRRRFDVGLDDEWQRAARGRSRWRSSTSTTSRPTTTPTATARATTACAPWRRRCAPSRAGPATSSR